MSTNGQDMLEFLSFVDERGLANHSYVLALRVATKNILSVEDNWRDLEISTIDDDAIIRRFTNKRSKDFMPKTLLEYGRRFRIARSMFLEYVADPGNWKHPSTTNVRSTGVGNVATKKKATSVVKEPASRSLAASSPPTNETGIQMLEYPYYIREGCIVRMMLPVDLAKSEADRLARFLKALAIDNEVESSTM